MVGTVFCVGTVGMYHSGIGGGGFALIRDSDGQYQALDFRESAPAAASQDMYKNQKEKSIYGGLAVGVPSEVIGLETMHKQRGVLPWKTVMQGAIRVARDGFIVSKDLVYKLDGEMRSGGTYLVEQPEWAEDFAPNGTLVREGDLMTRKRYANTLERIANEGSSAFYEGEIAEDMVSHVQKMGGIMTLEDLQTYKVLERPVLSIDYRGRKVYGMGSPSGGPVALYILKLMEQYDTSAWNEDRNLTFHRLAEAMRFAYAARGHLGDPGFVDKEDVLKLEQHLLSPENVEAIQKRMLDDKTQHPSAYDEDKLQGAESHGTSHIVTADSSGMVVSLTTTVNLIFGARIMEPKSGIILNDEMNDFSIPGVDNEFGFAPSEANFIRPFKRPVSSMTPLIAELADGSFLATAGAGGGSRIISATAQTMWHVIEHNMTMHDAMAHARLHDQLVPNVLNLEIFLPDRDPTRKALEQKGHHVNYVWPGQSAVQGIKLNEDGGFEAVGEPRQNNSAGFTA